jgi:hypothetical protein
MEPMSALVERSLMVVPRSRTLTTAVALLVALAVAGPAEARVGVTARDVPLSAGGPRATAGLRVLAPQTAPAPFTLVGIHWRGSGEVSFRTAQLGGRWSPWRAARPEAEDLPDAGTAEAGRRAGWKLGNPYWTGKARRLQVRVSGAVSQVRAFYVSSPVTVAPVRGTAAPAKPAIVTRAGWNANEAIVRGTPSFASRLSFAVVHHTAGTRPSSPAQSAAIVRAVQAYHVSSNGWNDIGYNFLVDPFGQVFEGRKGGVQKNVIGAHAQGFNTGSVGVALLGTYESAGVSKAARTALTALLAWRLDLAHVDPASKLTWISGGNPKFPAGRAVSLRAVSGHRDTGPTACPGAQLYATLGSLAADARALGGPKIFDPRVVGSIGGPVRFTARLSDPLAWTVTVLDGAGGTVAGGSGTGTVVDWTWNATSAIPGRYTYRIEAGTGVRAAAGPVGNTPPLELTSLTADTAVVTPNGDGRSDAQSVRVAVNRPAALDLRLENASGATVATFASGRALAPGTTTITWKDGRAPGGTTIPDGRYTFVAEVTAGVERKSARLATTVDRTLGHVDVGPTPFSPNGDGRRDTAAIGFTLSRQASVLVRVYAGKAAVATLVNGTRAAGRTELTWNGAGAPNGALRVTVRATTAALGARNQERPLVLDTGAPAIRLLGARRQKRGTYLRFRLGEPAALTIRYGTKTVQLPAKAGIVALWRPYRPSAVTITATDAAENVRSVTARVQRR